MAVCAGPAALAGPAETGDSHAAQENPSPPDPVSWQIRLDRPRAVGDRFSLSAEGSQRRHTVTSGSPAGTKEIRDEKLQIHYEGIHEVTSVDTLGHPTGVTIRIDRLTTDDGSGVMEQFAGGTLLTATVDGNQTLFRLGRDTLEGTLADALNLAGANLPAAREPSEDAVFLNQTERLPGDEWTADPQRLADAIAATSPFLIDPVTSWARLRFDGPETESSIPSLATTTTFDIVPTAFREPLPGRPLTESSMKVTNLRLFPVDPALPMLRETVKTKMTLIQRTGAGPFSADSTTEFERDVTRRILPLDPGSP